MTKTYFLNASIPQSLHCQSENAAGICIAAPSLSDYGVKVVAHSVSKSDCKPGLLLSLGVETLMTPLPLLKKSSLTLEMELIHLSIIAFPSNSI